MDNPENVFQGKMLISELLADDPDLRDMVEEFVEGLEQRVTELQRAYEHLDWEQLKTLAHRLKGAGGSYGYPEISRVAADMEQQFKTHSMQTFDHQVQALKDLATAARDGLTG